MSDIIWNVEFTDNKTAKEKDLSFSKKIDYITRKEATKNNEERLEGNKKKWNDKTEGYITRGDVLKHAKEKFNKYDEKNKTIMFSNGEPIKEFDYYNRIRITKEIDTIQKKYENSCLYHGVISFTPEFEDENIKGQYTIERFYEKMQPIIENFLIANNFVIENVNYCMSIHTNEKNLHMHLEFLEKSPTRKKNKLKDIEANVRKEIAESFDKEYTSKKFLEQKHKIMLLKEKVRKANFKIKDIDIENINKIRYSGDVKSTSIKKQILEERERIKSKSKEYKELEELLNKINLVEERVYGKRSRSLKKSNIEEIDKRIDNYILKTLKSRKKLEGAKLEQSVKKKIGNFKEARELRNTTSVLKRQLNQKKREAEELERELGIIIH